MSFTALSTIGEFGLISRIENKIVKYNDELIKGTGDDAAVFAPQLFQVVTMDTLNEGVHFDLMYTPWKHLGYKAAMVNFSDIYAMNAQPRYLLVSIALTNKVSVEMLDQFYDGLNLACKQHKVDIIGGDTTASKGAISISITVIGETDKDNIVYRSGAKPNDLICVTGNLGAAYAGLQIMEREKKIFEQTGTQPELEGYSYVCERFLKPEARFDIIEKLKSLTIKPSSMIDISDGLSSELLHISKQSGVGFQIYEEKIPVATETFKVAEEFSMNPIVFALNGGEDYELLFTVPLSLHNVVSAIPDVSIIGHVTDAAAGCMLTTRAGTVVSLESQGWNAF